MSSMSSAPVSSVGTPQAAKITRGHSCVLCRRRKIKCDGQHPCRNCQKSRAECVAAEITPAKRRKRKQEDIAARLKRAEETLSKAGLKIEDEDEMFDAGDGDERDATVSMDSEIFKPYLDKPRTIDDGKLIVEKGQTRYIEGSMWGNVSTEVREDSVRLLQDSSEDEAPEDTPLVPDHCSLLFGRLLVRNSLTSIHPPPVQIFRLWQVFLNNVNPVTKIVHAPTIQELLLQAMSDVDKVSASTEALMFAIYHSAIVSIDDEACQHILGESRVITLAKYSTAIQQALINAKLLRTSNLMVLQALALYLLSIRTSTDHDTLWILSGVATKIGQRLGLHRDSASASLSVLEAEIRRRLWWVILSLEGRSSFFSGSATPAAILIQPPSRVLNVNDSDLSPSMREPPVEQAAITEMLFLSVSYEIGLFMYEHVFGGGKSTSPVPDQTENLASKLKSVDEFENSLEQRYLRYCDPSIPLHYLAQLVVRSSLSKNRLRLYSLPRSADAPPQPQAEKDAAFAISLKILELYNESHSSAGKSKLKGFMWHIRVFFQVEGFIYTLSELRVRTTGVEVDRAWWLVEATYLHHDELLRERKNKLWVAIGNLCLKAWEQRVKGLRSQRDARYMTTPVFVKELYAQRGVKDLPVSVSGAQERDFMDLTNQIEVPAMQGGQGLGAQWGDINMPSMYGPLDSAESGAMDWEYWQTLFDDNGLPLFA